jgi:hypothetical protein
MLEGRVGGGEAGHDVAGAERDAGEEVPELHPLVDGEVAHEHVLHVAQGDT